MYTLFSGIKVVDLTKVLSGPLATRYLADYGAEVIKIESVTNPDPAREFPPLKGDWSGYFELFNRNKKSLMLDLSDPDQLNDFYELVREADVVVENMRPSAKYSLKIDYKTLKKLNPNIIYASLSGIDQTSDIKYFDVIAQAESGMMSLTGVKEPTKIGPAVVDAYAGLTLAFGIASALFKRERTGKGSNLSVSMLGSALNLLEHNLIEASLTHNNPLLPGNQDNAIAPFGVYKTRDGHVVLALGTPHQWNIFAKEFSLDKPQYSTNSQRVSHQSELTNDIEKVFSAKNTTEVIDCLANLGLPSARVKTMTDVLADEWMYSSESLQKNSEGYVTTGFSLRFDNEKKTKDSAAPKLLRTKHYGV